MDFSAPVLGTATVDKLKAKISTPILVIGKDVFSRSVFAHVDCFHFQAAHTLSRVLKQEYPKLSSITDVYEQLTPEHLALPRIGVTALAVLGAAFQAKGLGGNKPLENWVRLHLEKEATLVTFTSIKHRDEKERAEERKRLKLRKSARRDRAQQIRVDRLAAKYDVTNKQGVE